MACWKYEKACLTDGSNSAAGVDTPEVQAARKPLELKWNEFSNMIVGHKVAITLTDDLIVGGEVASVRDDSIVLDVTVPTKGFPRGNGVVRARQSS